MRHSEAVAKSYAKALFELARERKQVDAVGKELEAVAAVMTQQPALVEFLSRPWVSTPARNAARPRRSPRASSSSPLMRDFLEPGRRAQPRRSSHRDRGRVSRARRRSPGPRPREAAHGRRAHATREREQLSARLSRTARGKTLIIEELVDPQLLGGFVAEVGSMILDGSLDTQLDRMRDRLARA